MFTEDPGLESKDRLTKKGGPNGTYKLGINGENPNKYRLGALYVGYKNQRYGLNSEKIRHIVQNKLIHDSIGSPHFKVLNNNWYLYGGHYSRNGFSAW